jgi:ElaB/YqjD/DUF883 family membrane-anchored ribosome-binding protein
MKTQSEKNTHDKFDKIVDKFDDKAENVREKASNYISQGMAGAESAIDSLSDISERITHRVEDAVQKGLKQVKNTSADAEALVKKYPLYTVAGAVAISFLAGMLCGKASNKR